MKVTGDYHFEASVRDVWDALFDPAVLAAAMPGCEKLERVDGQFVGEMKIKIGPVSGTFSGKVELADVDEPNRYRMIIDGRGSSGFVKATATMELAPDGEGTKLHYAGDAQVGGKLASVGERLIDASSRAIVKQSLDNLHENVKIRAAAHRAAVEQAEAAARASAEAKATSDDAAASTPAPAPTPVPVPAPELKRAQASDFAAGVAKEVTRSLAPWLIGAAVVIAIVLWILLS